MHKYDRQTDRQTDHGMVTLIAVGTITYQWCHIKTGTIIRTPLTHIENWSVTWCTSWWKQQMVVSFTVWLSVSLKEILSSKRFTAVHADKVLRMPQTSQRHYHLQQMVKPDTGKELISQHDITVHAVTAGWQSLTLECSKLFFFANFYCKQLKKLLPH